QLVANGIIGERVDAFLVGALVGGLDLLGAAADGVVAVDHHLAGARSQHQHHPSRPATHRLGRACVAATAPALGAGRLPVVLVAQTADAERLAAAEELFPARSCPSCRTSTTVSSPPTSEVTPVMVFVAALIVVTSPLSLPRQNIL